MWIVAYLILLGLSLLGILVLVLDLIPNLYPKVLRKLKGKKTIDQVDQNFEQLIFDASMKMIDSKKEAMIWEDRPKSFTDTLLTLHHKKIRKGSFTRYNFPRAFLLLGALSYILKNENKDELNNFIKKIDEYIDENGEATFRINIVDQGTYGIIALMLYKELNEQRYMLFAESIYEYISSQIDPQTGIIDYRPNTENIYVDMIGLALPFLVEYGRAINDNTIINLAKKQIKYYLSFGVDHNTYLPSHGFNKKTKVKVGAANWGRGIGWFFIGFAYYNQYYKDFESEFDSLQASIINLKTKEELWTQFPGTSFQFDASTTTLCLYSILLNNPDYSNSKIILNQLKEYLTTDGYILNTSGDTYTFNKYSNSFGKSELSQGVLLLILSLMKKTE